MRSNIQVRVPTGGSDRNDKSEYGSQPNGSIVHGRTKRNYPSMEQIGKIAANLLGGTAAIFAFITNLDNVISWMLGFIGIVWAVINARIKYEDYRIKKIDRLEREEKYNDRPKRKVS